MSAAGKGFVRRRGTTAIPNATVHDKELSYNALGLLLVILAQPERAAGNGYRHYMRPGTGQAAVLSAFRELETRGYRYQFKRKGKGGKFVTDTVVSETPMTRAEAEQWHASKVTDPTSPTREKSRTEPAQSQAFPRTDNHAWKPTASSVPEDQGSLTSYLSKEPVDPKSIECPDCNRSFSIDDLSQSGRCRDCLPAPARHAKPEQGPGFAQYRELREQQRSAREAAERRAQQSKAALTERMQRHG